MQKIPYMNQLLFGGAAAAGFVAWRCCARRRRDATATGQKEEAAAAAGAPPQDQEQECAPAAEPPPSDAGPAPAPAAARPSGSVGRWQPRRLRAESCPDDFVSEQQRRGETAAAGDVARIDNNLFLSSYQGSGAKAKMLAEGVTHVLSLDAELRPKHPETFTYKTLDLQDDEYTNILARLPEAMAFIQQAQQEGGACLVHCEKGKSRSVTTVLAWLMLRGGQGLRRAWAQVHEARPQSCPNAAFKRQLLRLQMMAQTGNNFQEHALYAFHQMEHSLINTKPAEEVQNRFNLSVDPAEYAETEQSGGCGGPALMGLVCVTCGRVVASPLNLFWVGSELQNGPGTGPAASDDERVPDAIAELVLGALGSVSDPEDPGGAARSSSPEAACEVHCVGCHTQVGSRHLCTAAVAQAYAREPQSGQWQRAAGALASGAPEELLPQWCAVFHRGRTRLAPLALLPGWARQPQPPPRERSVPPPS